MSKLNAATIEALLTHRPVAPTVSIYMPTHSAASPPNMGEDRLRFKNLRTRTMKIIKQMPEVDIRSARAIERTLTQLENDLEFWEHQRKGLAIFVDPQHSSTFSLPIDCDEYMAVDNHFHITPLLGLLYEAVDYYVLVISQQVPRLFTGDMYDLYETDAKLPTTETGKRGHKVTNENARQPVTGERSRPQYFGKDFPLEVREDKQHFFRAIDQAIRRYCDTKRPLILAGSEPEVELFRAISTYPNILAQHIRGNNAAPNPHTLFPFAWAVISQTFVRKRQHEVIDYYKRLGGTPERTALSVAAIQDAAGRGRISTLLVKLLHFTTDTVRDNKIDVPKLKFLPNEQMITTDTIALQTWRNHGDIVLLDDTSTTPPNVTMAAILRY